MALINCPECSKEVSTQAQSCPNCGYPIDKVIKEKEHAVKNNNYQAPKIETRIRPLGFLIGLTMICFGFYLLFSYIPSHDLNSINVNINDPISIANALSKYGSNFYHPNDIEILKIISWCIIVLGLFQIVTGGTKKINQNMYCKKCDIQVGVLKRFSGNFCERCDTKINKGKFFVNIFILIIPFLISLFVLNYYYNNIPTEKPNTVLKNKENTNIPTSNTSNPTEKPNTVLKNKENTNIPTSNTSNPELAHNNSTRNEEKQALLESNLTSNTSNPELTHNNSTHNEEKQVLLESNLTSNTSNPELTHNNSTRNEEKQAPLESDLTSNTSNPELTHNNSTHNEEKQALLESNLTSNTSNPELTHNNSTHNEKKQVSSSYIVAEFIEYNKVSIAKSIQNIAHPTGEDPKILKTSIFNEKNTFDIIFTVKWKGGFLGGDYITKVKWKFNVLIGHMQTIIVHDTAITKIKNRNKIILDKYFQNAYMELIKNINKDEWDNSDDDEWDNDDDEWDNDDDEWDNGDDE